VEIQSNMSKFEDHPSSWR